MALVLTRKSGESVRIGEAIVKIASIDGNKVSLAITAPQEIEIVRTEIDTRDNAARRGFGGERNP